MSWTHGERVFLTAEEAEAMIADGDEIRVYTVLDRGGENWTRDEILKLIRGDVYRELTGKATTANGFGLLVADSNRDVWFIATKPGPADQAAKDALARPVAPPKGKVRITVELDEELALFFIDATHSRGAFLEALARGRSADWASVVADVKRQVNETRLAELDEPEEEPQEEEADGSLKPLPITWGPEIIHLLQVVASEPFPATTPEMLDALGDNTSEEVLDLLDLCEANGFLEKGRGGVYSLTDAGRELAEKGEAG